MSNLRSGKLGMVNKDDGDGDDDDDDDTWCHSVISVQFYKTELSQSEHTLFWAYLISKIVQRIW